MRMIQVCVSATAGCSWACLFTRDPQFANNLKLTEPTNSIASSELRVTRRIPIYYLLALGVSAFTGCNFIKGKKDPSANPIGGTGNNFGQSPPKVGIKNNPKSNPNTPANLQVGNDSGRVMLVDQGLAFVVVEIVGSKLPPPEMRYLVLRQGQPVGEITTTEQTDDTYLVADINKGDIRVGDSVRPK